MASGIYNSFKSELMNKVMDLEADTLKVALYDNSHAFTDTDDSYTATNEISGTGYTATGATLANGAVTTDETDNEGVFDADDTAWTSASFSAYHAVIYDDTVTTPNANQLIASIDFGGIQTVNA